MKTQSIMSKCLVLWDAQKMHDRKGGIICRAQSVDHPSNTFWCRPTMNIQNDNGPKRMEELQAVVDSSLTNMAMQSKLWQLRAKSKRGQVQHLHPYYSGNAERTQELDWPLFSYCGISSFFISKTIGRVVSKMKIGRCICCYRTLIVFKALVGLRIVQ